MALRAQQPFPSARIAEAEGPAADGAGGERCAVARAHGRPISLVLFADLPLLGRRELRGLFAHSRASRLAATAVTSPDAETVATPGALLVHTKVRPMSERTLFAASRATTVACVVLPVVRLESGTVPITDPSDEADTVSANVAGPTPSTVTPMVDVPALAGVISPDAETVATLGSLLLQTTVRPVSDRMLFAASRATTVA